MTERAAQVQDDVPVSGPGDQSGAMQHTEVLADRRRAQAQLMCEVGRAGWLCEGGENSGAGTAEQVGQGLRRDGGIGVPDRGQAPGRVPDARRKTRVDDGDGVVAEE
nr:hypothetical protein [Micromonospora sp. BL4]